MNICFSLKTSLLKWRPDYDTAADEYNKAGTFNTLIFFFRFRLSSKCVQWGKFWFAATCFRVAKSIEKAKECLIKAAECYRENKSLFHAAKSLDQTVILCKESGTPREIQKLAEEACNLYQQHGSLDSGASVLDKAAKILEHHHPEIALQLFQHAADVVMVII